MLESLLRLGALCTTGTVLQGGLLLGLFAAGAAGSVMHCGPMCGVFVLGQVSDRMARLPASRMCERRRIESGLLLPYHLGRLTTYAGLGAVAATAIGRFPWFARLSAGLLTVAALLFLAHALARLLPSLSGWEYAPRAWARLIGTITRYIPRGTAFGEYLLGAALGFLPCGFLYAALAAAAAAATPVLGAAAMLAFGLGTTPILMAVGIAGSRRLVAPGINRAAPALMVLNAALLLILAWQRLA